MAPTKFMKLGILLWLFVKWEWKIAKFTGAWMFIIPFVVVSLIGPSLITDMLILISTVFCIGWTTKNIVRRNNRQKLEVASAPPEIAPESQGGIFFGSQE